MQNSQSQVSHSNATLTVINWNKNRKFNLISNKIYFIGAHNQYSCFVPLRVWATDKGTGIEGYSGNKRSTSLIIRYKFQSEVATVPWPKFEIKKIIKSILNWNRYGSLSEYCLNIASRGSGINSFCWCICCAGLFAWYFERRGRFHALVSFIPPPPRPPYLPAAPVCLVSSCSCSFFFSVVRRYHLRSSIRSVKLLLPLSAFPLRSFHFTVRQNHSHNVDYVFSFIHSFDSIACTNRIVGRSLFILFYLYQQFDFFL